MAQFDCGICGFQYQHKTSLIRHVKEKHQKQDFSCKKHCSKTFLTKKELERHKIEFRAKACHNCGETFQTNYNKARHEKTCGKNN